MKKSLFSFCLLLGTVSLSATNDTINLADASFGINQVDASYYVSGNPAQAYYSFSIWNNDDDYPELRIEAKVTSDVYIQGTHDVDLDFSFLELDAATRYTISKALFCLKFTGKNIDGDPLYDILAVVNASNGKVYRYEANIPVFAYDADDNPIDLKDAIDEHIVIPVIYAITYDLAGGALEAGKHNPDSYIADDLPITLNNPVRVGHTFAGWTGSNGNEPQTNVTLAQGETGDKNYTANWTINKYTITFKNEDGSVLCSEQWNYGTMPSCDEPTKADDEQYTYTFAGWNPSVVAVSVDAEYWATYTATPKPTTNIVPVANNEQSATKIMRNGQLFILREGKTYNAHGARVE